MMRRRRTARLTRDHRAESRCPDCGGVNTFEIDTPIRPLTTIRARAHCGCGRTYSVDLERRCGVRKQITLHGHYRRRGDKTKRPMTIRNVSRSGLMFETDDGRVLRLGERIEIDFSFGQPDARYVRRQVKVLRLADDAFGAQFTAGKRADPLEPADDLALALYNPGIRTL